LLRCWQAWLMLEETLRSCLFDWSLSLGRVVAAGDWLRPDGSRLASAPPTIFGLILVCVSLLLGLRAYAPPCFLRYFADLRCSCGAGAVGGVCVMVCLALHSDLQRLNRGKSPGCWDWVLGLGSVGARPPSVVRRGGMGGLSV
jgi:hypothetical protein